MVASGSSIKNSRRRMATMVMGDVKKDGGRVAPNVGAGWVVVVLVPAMVEQSVAQRL